MTKSQQQRFFINRSREEKEYQITSSLILLAQYHEEVIALTEALERLSSLPRELNYWYGKYSSIRQQYEDSLKRLQGYKDQNQALARRLEKVQVSWYRLDTQLRQRSEQFHFAYSCSSV